jgi:hypothetical protein
MSNETPEFKVIMCGPSRVGKTSLITAILEESRKLFAGRNLFVKPVGETERRIDYQINELRGSIDKGEFNPGALGGTQDKFVFELDMGVYRKKVAWWKKDVSGKEPPLRWGILDYPGRWIDGGYPNESARQEFEDWRDKSSVLIIPIDAVVVMEATIPKEKTARQHVLQIAQVTKIASDWAKARTFDENGQGVAIFAPVKCESYFKDNGGRIDKSVELRETVKQVYRTVIDCIDGESGKISIQYHPIDTIGCVELNWGRWEPSKSQDDSLDYKGNYSVREGGVYNPFAAGDLLLSICQHIINAERKKKKYSGPFGRIVKILRSHAPQLLKEIKKINKSRSEPLRIKNNFNYN